MTEIKSPENKMYNCHYCDTKFDNKHEAKLHLFEKHQDKQIKFKCSICDMKFDSKQDAKIHRDGHNSSPVLTNQNSQKAPHAMCNNTNIPPPQAPSNPMFPAIPPPDVFKNYHQNLMVGPPHPMQNPNVMQFPQENQRDPSEYGEKPVEKDQKSPNQNRKTSSSKPSFKKSAQPSQQTQMLRQSQRKTQIRMGKIENKPFICV